MLLIAIFYYFLISLLVFAFWLRAFIADSTTDKRDPTSWLVLIIGTSLWPLVLPFAYLELMNKFSKQRNYR